VITLSPPRSRPTTRSPDNGEDTGEPRILTYPAATRNRSESSAVTWDNNSLEINGWRTRIDSSRAVNIAFRVPEKEREIRYYRVFEGCVP